MTAKPYRAPLQGHRLAVVHLIEVAVVLVLLALAMRAAAERYAQLASVSPTANILVGELRPQDAQVLEHFGLSVQAYAAYYTIFEILFETAFLSIALAIVWFRPADLVAIMVGLMFASAAMTVASLAVPENTSWMPVAMFRFIWSAVVIPLFFLFPDGRFVPSRSRWLAGAWLVYNIAWLIFPALRPPFSFGLGIAPADLPRIAWLLVWLLGGIAAQVYRYLKVSNSIQRQQTKWVVLGFAALGMTFAGYAWFTFIFSGQSSPGVLIVRMVFPSILLLAGLVMPLSIGISVLRYRLWDVDIIIRRTLLYGALTITLALAYITSVVLLQNLFRALTGQLQSPTATVISTLAIAALFTPLRRRLQDTVDRRFYRRHYDAEKMLAAFASKARDEVELENLTGYLLSVVAETMQPERLGIWLKHPTHGQK